MPAGRPTAVRPIGPVNPLTDVTVTENVADPFVSSAWTPGVTVSLNEGVDPAPQIDRARETLSLPPEIVLPLRALTASADAIRLDLSSDVDREHADKTSAAAPETIGAAADVPLVNS